MPGRPAGVDSSCALTFRICIPHIHPPFITFMLDMHVEVSSVDADDAGHLANHSGRATTEWPCFLYCRLQL
jgi:hypothetical protein